MARMVWKLWVLSGQCATLSGMEAITTKSLSRKFRTKVKAEGLGAGLRALAHPEYRETVAVDSVNLEVSRGEVVAFLGPNGAGKSTTIKMLTGILTPSSGTARVLGLDPSRDRRRLAMRIGTVFGQRSQLWLHLPPADSFNLLGAIYEVDPVLLRSRRSVLEERFGIRELMDIPVRRLSLGQRIRCEIAASLLHAPEVLFLDEPTIGLDVIAKREIRSLLSELNREDGVTVFLTSHDIGDIEKVCKRAIIVHHGKIVVDESMKTLKHRALSKKYIGVKYASPVSVDPPFLVPVKRTPDAASFVVDTSRHRLEEVLRFLVAAGEIEDLTVEDEPLENIIAEVYGSRSVSEAEGVVVAGKGGREGTS